jgi:hypothetical protein
MTAAFDLGGLANGSPATGFQNQTDSTIAFNDGLMRFSIWPTVPGGTFNVFVGGMQFIKTVQEDYVWTDTEGLWVAYYDGAGVLQATQNSTLISNIFKGAGAPVAAWYWDATNNLTLRQIDERHNVGLDPYTHWYLHTYFGTAYESGLGLADFTIVAGAATLPAHAQFSVGNGVVADEDLRRLINDGFPQDLAPILNAPIFYLSGATPGVWRRKAADVYPLIYSGTAGYVGANGRLPYNQLSGGNWLLTEISSPDFVLVHYFATTDINEPVIGVQGQAIYLTAAAARAGALTEINTILGLSALLSTEKRAIASVIFQSGTAYANVPKAKVVVTDTGANYVDWRATAFFAGIVGAPPPNPQIVHLFNGSTQAIEHVGRYDGPGTSPGEYVFLPSGAADDAARFNALGVAGWRRFKFVNAIYLATTPFVLQSKTTLLLDPQTDIRGTLATATPADALFVLPTAVITAVAILNSAVSEGDDTITVQAPSVPGQLVAGCYVILTRAAHTETKALHRVESVTGAGAPYTVKLDRGVERNRAATDQINIYPTVPHDVTIYANGAKASALANRIVEFSIAWNCHVYQLMMNDDHGSCTGPVASMDIPSKGCSFNACEISLNVLTPTQPGFYLESNSGGYLRSCRWRGCAGGSQIVDSTNSHAVDCEGTGETYGLYVGTGVADTVESCQDVSAIGGRYTGAMSGVKVSDGTIRPVLSGFNVELCTYGIVIDQFTVDAVLREVTARKCDLGIIVVANAKVRIESPELESCTYGVLVGSSTGAPGVATGAVVEIVGWKYRSTNASHRPIEIKTGARVTLRDSSIALASNAGIWAGAAAGNIKLTIDNVDLACPAICNGIVWGGPGSVLDVSRLRITGCSAAAYYGITLSDLGGSMRLGPANDFSTCDTPYHPLTEVNQKEVALTGTVPVVIPFADLKLGELPSITRKTIVGTRGDPLYTVTPGVGISIVSTEATDTGVVNYRI